MIEDLAIEAITQDERLQPRNFLDAATIQEYAEAIKNGDEFPPVIVFDVGGLYLLADGYHRVNAAIQAGQKKVSAEIRTGTIMDALKYAMGANSKHGLRRSQADKRRIAVNATMDFHGMSNREIARMTGIDDKTIAKYRALGREVMKPDDTTNEVLNLLKESEGVVARHREGWLYIINVEGDYSYVMVAYAFNGLATVSYNGRGCIKDGLRASVFIVSEGLDLRDFEAWVPMPSKMVEHVREMLAEFRTREMAEWKSPKPLMFEG